MTSQSQAHSESRVAAPQLGLFPRLIFGSRWLQLPLYVGLIVAQAVYVLLFLKELWHLAAHWFMISNLLVMVIVGGYQTFVSDLNLRGHRDEPEWLSHVNASVLKIKLAMAIVGISSISLLRTFIEAGEFSKLAAELGVSLHSLQENFQRYLGYSPRDWILTCRLERARERLRSLIRSRPR